MLPLHKPALNIDGTWPNTNIVTVDRTAVRGTPRNHAKPLSNETRDPRRGLNFIGRRDGGPAAGGYIHAGGRRQPGKQTRCALASVGATACGWSLYMCV